MIGSTNSWLSVNSIVITAEVSGACVTPARYADMPRRIAAVGAMCGSQGANIAPSPAPTANAGEKIPPGIPAA